VLPGDDEHTLHDRIKPVERRLLIDVVRRIATGELDLAAVRDARTPTTD
jgi:phosphoribosylglycinamide formyltransferase-1